MYICVFKVGNRFFSYLNFRFICVFNCYVWFFFVVKIVVGFVFVKGYSDWNVNGWNKKMLKVKGG